MAVGQFILICIVNGDRYTAAWNEDQQTDVCLNMLMYMCARKKENK